MIELHIDNERFTAKPDDYTIVKVANRISQYKATYTIREFANLVGNQGQAFLPVIMEGGRKSENFVQQQVFSLDFDETLSLEEFWSRTKLVGLYPAFIYKTLNCHENNDRYRAVYINDCVIEHSEAAKLITGMLLYLFPEGDQNCKDLARYYLGGKGLLHLDENATISADGVAISLKTYIAHVFGKNHTRQMEKIANDLGVSIDKGVFRILVECKENISEEIWASTHIIYMGQIQNSSTIYFYEKWNSELNKEQIEIYKSRKQPKQIRNKKAQDICKCCKLFRDHYEFDLHHNLKFMLATNLYHFKGGKDIFFKGLTDHQEKWKSAWKTIGVNEYLPQSCVKGNCPYADECKCYSLYDKMQRRITIKGMQKFIPLEEGTQLLNQYVNEAVSSGNKDIFLIKAQTAIGKTYTYCNMIESRDENEKPVLIAVPTNKLQEDVYKDIKRRTENVRMTYNLAQEVEKYGFAEISESAKELYKKGFGKKVKKYVSDELKKETLHTITEMQLKIVIDSKKIFDGTTHIVTTHAMLLNLPEDILKMYEIIVDEDILLTIFNGTETISFGELETALKSNVISVDNKEKIQGVLKQKNDFIGYSSFHKLNNDDLNRLYKEELPIQSSIPGFFKSSTYHVDTTMKTVTYFDAKELPKVPLTIVSATIDEELYKDYFKERRFEFRTVPLIKYKGKLIQYTMHSVSRQFINDHTWKNVKESVDKITGNQNINLITFKSYAGGKDIYFGKTAGFNDYLGQDVCVVGTPHNVPFVYRLIGKHMRYASDDVMAVKKVENEIYAFSIMTFGNVKMCNLQLYFLESELEQAVGRARLLRRDCSVYLFSNYPLRQAEIIQDDYLIVEDVEE